MTDITPEWLRSHGFALDGETYKNEIMWVRKNPHGTWTLNIATLYTVTAQAKVCDVEKLAEALRLSVEPEPEPEKSEA